MVEIALLLSVALVPGWRSTPWPALPLWAVAFAAYAAACSAYPDTARGRRAAWVLGVGARLALLPLLPHFSDDVYRYLWDGHVAASGLNPFLHAPAHPALAPLRTGWHALVNHPEVATIYPPGAQLVFHALTLAARAIGAALQARIVLFKAAWVVADLGAAWALARLAAPAAGEEGGRNGRLASAALPLWLLSPLVLVEVAWSGHLEPLGILPMLAGLLLLRREDGAAGTAGGALLGAGAAVKFAPAAALPALWRRGRRTAAALLLAVPLLLYAPYLGAGASLLAGLGEYASRWAFNAGAFRLLEGLLPGALALPLAGRIEAARAAALAFPALALAVAIRRRWPPARTLLWCLGAGLVFSPTLHPWYVLWVLPLAVLRGSRAWVLLSGLVLLAYAGLDAYSATGTWPHPAALSALIHVPFLAALGLEAARPHLRRRLRGPG